jgi:hypothetical protein
MLTDGGPLQYIDLFVPAVSAFIGDLVLSATHRGPDRLHGHDPGRIIAVGAILKPQRLGSVRQTRLRNLHDRPPSQCESGMRPEYPSGELRALTYIKPN